jgi:uncharacterized protein (TIGR02302 family)
MTEKQGRNERATGGRLLLLTLAARIALFVERLIELAAPAAAVLLAAVALAWSGLWLGAPPWLRGAADIVCLLAFVFALAPLRHLRWVDGRQARAALDSGHEDAPAAALADALANPSAAPTHWLWEAHLRRARAGLRNLRPPLPAPALTARDRYGLGALAALALVATGFVAGPEKYIRLAAAFDLRGVARPGAAVRVDAWIDPPRYTGKPPIVLPLNGGDEQKISAPVGSILVARASDPRALSVSISGGIEASPDKGDEKRYVLRGDGRLRLSGAASGAFALHAEPDLPPKIAVVGDIKINARGSFALSYRIDDDYGVRDAKIAASSAAKSPSGRPDGGRALYAPPEGPLELPAAPGGLGEGHATLDWSDSPYAGQTVDLRLSAHDEAGQEGEAVVKTFILPQKALKNPLALALAEQRRILALESGRRGDVQTALEALDLAPEVFTPQLSVHLGLRYAMAALRGAHSDDNLRETCDFLWAMALQIEDGDLSQAERELRAAEKALREALKNGASQEEIQKLTRDLQKAMENFLAEMAKKSQHKSAQSQSGEGQSVSPEDFQKLLDKMKQAMEDGDMETAQALLDQMQSMLENLKNAESGPSQKSRNLQTRRDLDKMMREQQQLRDETSEHEREKGSLPLSSPLGPREGKAQGGEKGQQGQRSAGGERAPAGETLEQRQGKLREKLDALRRGAATPDGKSSEGLKQAEDSMKGAEDALKRGDDGQAMSDQQQALEQMGKSAGEMAKGDKEGQDSEEAGGQNRPGKNKNGEGPFDNAQRGDNVKATAAQKARKILDEVRKRLADPSRAQDELDYLERLIRPN